MPDDFITSVKVELRGGHEQVSVWVRGQLVGTLVTGIGDGERMKAVLLGARTTSDPSWLVRDFHALYRAAQGTMGAASLTETTAARTALRFQLDRLRSAFAECEAVRRMGRARRPQGKDPSDA